MTTEEIEEAQTMITLFMRRTNEHAVPKWQKEHKKPGVYPDLGTLIKWILKKAELAGMGKKEKKAK